ncbi:hypothetical protein AAVH_22862 [Aphelenchoides avenae]|nr:hypothetical protein AAVH_22862 [Aphelenchus avenae]
MGGSKKVNGDNELDPRRWSGWAQEKPCGHSQENWHSTAIKWYKVQMASGATDGWVTTGRVLAGILSLGITEAAIDKKDLTHECILVWFKCRVCDHQFGCTFEILNDEDGKLAEWGRYENYIECRRAETYQLSFDFIHNKCFAAMWENYKWNGHNCYHWSRDFMCKLANKDPSAYVYGKYG